MLDVIVVVTTNALQNVVLLLIDHWSANQDKLIK